MKVISNSSRASALVDFATESGTTYGATFARSPGLPSVLLGGTAPSTRTLLDVFDESVARWPDEVALEDRRRRFTYRQLDRDASRLAERLSRLDVGRGDFVGIHIPSGSADLYVAILGVLKSGAAYLPIEFADPPARVEELLAQVDPCAVVSAGLEVTRLKSGSRLGHRALPHDDCWIMCTSGSTGSPKVVAVTHRSAAAFVDAEASLFKARPEDRVQAGLSVSFDASCEEIWLAWRNGAALIATPRATLLSAEVAEGWIVDNGITVISTVPSLARLWSQDSWDRLRIVVLGGEPCPKALAGQSGRTELWNTYGPTEATVVSTAKRLDDREPTIGTPLAGWNVAVIDEEGEVVPVGQEGELVIAGVGLGRYLDRALDREHFAPLPALGWQRAYRTGDRVRLGANGLEFLGRSDDQVKINGRRLELGQVDAALMEMEGVEAAACVVRESASGNPVLVGYIAGGVDLAEASAQLSRRLPAGLVPLLVRVEEFPRAASGKVARCELPWPVEEVSRGLDHLGELGSWLTDLVRDQLGPVNLFEETNFFDIGGNSLAAAKLVSAIRSRFPTVGVADLYARPQLGQFAAWLAERPVTPQSDHRAPRARRRLRPVQLLGVLVSFLFAAPAYVVPVLTFNHFVNRPWAPTVAVWELAVLWAVLLSPPGRIVLVAGTKWVLLGRVIPGRYPRGGRVHMSIWFISRIVDVVNLDTISGTPWARIHARFLGARIAKDVRLDTLAPIPGLLGIGAGSSVEAGAELMNWCVEGDDFVVGGVSIGRDVRVGARSCLEPFTVICDDVEIEAGSVVSGRVEPGQRLGGAPATPCGRAGERWPAAHAPAVAPSRRRALNVLSGLLVLVMPLVVLAPVIPALLVLLRIERNSTTARGAILQCAEWAPLLALVTLVLYGLAMVAVTRLLRHGARPGIFEASSAISVGLWVSSRILQTSERVLFPLYKSMVTPWWLRRLGARIGRNCEITSPVGLPWLLEVGDSSFVADDVLIAPVCTKKGWTSVGRVVIGSRSFVGNSAILRSGTVLGDDTLVATATVAPEMAPESTSWLGAPAIEIPRIRRCGPDERTLSPPIRLKVARATVESLRNVACVGCWLALLGGVTVGIDKALAQLGAAGAFAATAMVLALCGAVAWIITASGKWILAGRYKEDDVPLWSSKVWRTEFVDALHEVLAGAWLSPFIVGTTVYNAYLRSLGARIGRNVWCETWAMNEFDLISMEDDVYMSTNCNPQTHLFHDRMLHTAAVHISGGSTLETQTVVLPDAGLGRQVLIYPRSLVMSAEQLAPGTSWQGVPVVGR